MNKITKIMFLVLSSFVFANLATAASFSLGIAGNAQVYAGKGVENNGAGTGIENVQEANGAFDSSHAALFGEININDTIAFGIEYVPEAITSPENINVQHDGGENDYGGTAQTNKAKVEYDDITTVYANVNLPILEGSYLKVGYIQMDVLTKETLGTGGNYNDVELEGILAGLGYRNNLDNGMFVGVELTVAEMDDVSATNTTDATKKVTIKDIYGATASLRIGKTF